MKNIYRLILRTKLNFETKEKEEKKRNLNHFFTGIFIRYLILFKDRRRLKKGNVSFIILL